MNIQSNTSNLLIKEPPLQVLPSLAVKVGLNESIFLQQLHYWLQRSEHFYDERKWVFNTYEGWQKQFSFWSIKTIIRIISNLENNEILLIGNYNRYPLDKTKWYSIDYQKLDSLTSENSQDNTQPIDISDLPKSAVHVDKLTTSSVQIGSPCGQVDQMHVDKLTTPITRDYSSENTTTTTERFAENSKSGVLKPEENQDVVVVDEKIKEKLKHTQFESLLPNSITLLETIKEHGIERVLSVFDILIFQYQDKKVDNPAGLLIKAIKQGLDRPPGYVSKEEKEEQEKKLKIKKQEQEDQQRKKEEEMKDWEDKFDRLDKLKQNLFLKRAKEKAQFIKNPDAIKAHAIDIFRQASNTTGVPP